MHRMRSASAHMNALPRLARFSSQRRSLIYRKQPGAATRDFRDGTKHPRAPYAYRGSTSSLGLFLMGSHWAIMPPLHGALRSLGTQMPSCFLLMPVVLGLRMVLGLVLAVVLALGGLLLMILTPGGLRCQMNLRTCGACCCCGAACSAKPPSLQPGPLLSSVSLFC